LDLLNSKNSKLAIQNKFVKNSLFSLFIGLSFLEAAQNKKDKEKQDIAL